MNLNSIGRADAVWQSIFEEVLQRGYHGTASVELMITDGTIQRITRSLQRIEKATQQTRTDIANAISHGQ